MSNNDGTNQGRQARSFRLPAWGWGWGALFGFGLWGLALLGALTLDRIESFVPRGMAKLDVVDAVGSACMIVAFPVFMTWFGVFGDRPPPPLAATTALNLVCGAAISILLGALSDTGFPGGDAAVSRTASS